MFLTSEAVESIRTKTKLKFVQKKKKKKRKLSQFIHNFYLDVLQLISKFKTQQM